MIRRHGGRIDQHEGVAAGAQRADLVPVAGEVEVAGDRVPAAHEHHRAPRIELERLRGERRDRGARLDEDAGPHQISRRGAVRIGPVGPQIEPRGEADREGRRLFGDGVGVGVQQLERGRGGALGQGLIGQVQAQRLPVEGFRVETGEQGVSRVRRSSGETEDGGEAEGTDPEHSHDDLLA
jgi:hypothetical protein